MTSGTQPLVRPPPPYRASWQWAAAAGSPALACKVSDDQGLTCSNRDPGPVSGPANCGPIRHSDKWRGLPGRCALEKVGLYMGTQVHLDDLDEGAWVIEGALNMGSWMGGRTQCRGSGVGVVL
eukprot:766018-Hanusia_phi.AAC.1